MPMTDGSLNSQSKPCRNSAKLASEFAAVATASFRIDQHGAGVPAATFTFGETATWAFAISASQPTALLQHLIRKDALQDCGDFDVALRSSEIATIGCA